MRVDGLSSRSYPVKRKPRKAIARVDDSLDGQDIESEFIAQEATSSRGRGAVSRLPAPQQDDLFSRSMSTRVAHALSSYLTTSTFVDWDTEVLGFDVHI